MTVILFWAQSVENIEENGPYFSGLHLLEQTIIMRRFQSRDNYHEAKVAYPETIK